MSVIYVETDDHWGGPLTIPRTPLSELPHRFKLVWQRVGGWSLVLEEDRYAQDGYPTGYCIVAGELHPNGLRVELDGNLICDSISVRPIRAG